MKKVLPQFRFKNVQSIDLELLKSYNIKGIFLDVDNTLIDYKQVIPDGIKEWIKKAKKMGYRICILSNSNKIDKIKKVAQDLKLDYIMSAKKPAKNGFEKAIKLIGLLPNEVAMVGDQLLTDVLGANIMGIISIYVDPINKKEYWYTRWKRPIEAVILKRWKEE